MCDHAGDRAICHEAEVRRRFEIVGLESVDPTSANYSRKASDRAVARSDGPARPADRHAPPAALQPRFTERLFLRARPGGNHSSARDAVSHVVRHRA